MGWETQTINALKAKDIDVVAYLPDSILSDLIKRLSDDDDFDMVLVAREEEAIGVLSGAWLGGRRGVLLCQTSGLANTFNALGSYSKPEGLPFLGLVTRRGELGEHNLAQSPAGYAMPRLLDDLGIRNHPLEDVQHVEQKVGMAAETAFSEEDPFVLFLEPSLTWGKE